MAAWRYPMFGKANPEDMTNEAWVWIVRNNVTAHRVDRLLDLLDTRTRKPLWWLEETHQPIRPLDRPAWTFDRMINSVTELDDGTKISIGGCHEDFYDADFYIYNDVVVERPDGSVEIYGYPRDVFPPTDQHTAVPVDEAIYIIGNGAFGAPRDEIPVYRLNLRDFSIQHIKTAGEKPTELTRAEGRLSDDGLQIIMEGGDYAHPEWSSTENIDSWALDLATLTWHRLTRKPWKRFVVFRDPWSRNRLSYFDTVFRARRSERWSTYDRKKEARLLDAGCVLDEELFRSRYLPPIEHEALETKTGFRASQRIRVQDIDVRYQQHDDGIYLTIEGILSPDVIETLLTDVMEKLSKLENCAYTYKNIDR